MVRAEKKEATEVLWPEAIEETFPVKFNRTYYTYYVDEILLHIVKHHNVRSEVNLWSCCTVEVLIDLDPFSPK
jgi:hypothetical protein